VSLNIIKAAAKHFYDRFAAAQFIKIKYRRSRHI
jgi:hypothetical protein